MVRKPKLVKAEDLYSYELATDFDISPDGQSVVYSVGRVERESEKKYSNLFLVRTGGGRPEPGVWSITACCPSWR